MECNFYSKVSRFLHSEFPGPKSFQNLIPKILKKSRRRGGGQTTTGNPHSFHTAPRATGTERWRSSRPPASPTSPEGNVGTKMYQVTPRNKNATWYQNARIFQHASCKGKTVWFQLCGSRMAEKRFLPHITSRNVLHQLIMSMSRLSIAEFFSLRPVECPHLCISLLCLHGININMHSKGAKLLFQSLMLNLVLYACRE